MEKKHCFTSSEKREFLKIIKKYGQLLDIKSNDSNTVRRKTIAWNRIACEYNTSTIAPYPASSKQLRRLWCNIKQRQKYSMKKLEEESPTSDAELPTEDTLEANDVEEEETDTPYFVNVGGSENQDDTLKTRENTQEKDTLFTAIDSEGRPCNVEFIDELEDDLKPTSQSRTEEKEKKERVKSNLLVREYQDRKRRLTELHILQKRLLTEQIREARAKANLAELELKQQQFLET